MFVIRGIRQATTVPKRGSGTLPGHAAICTALFNRRETCVIEQISVTSALLWPGLLYVDHRCKYPRRRHWMRLDKGS